MNDWVKPLDKKEQSLIDVISQHTIGASKEITVHKVWKLLESKRLETFKVSGNLMFGMDLFDVIDLTEKSKAIMMSKERGAPSVGKYKVKNEVIDHLLREYKEHQSDVKVRILEESFKMISQSKLSDVLYLWNQCPFMNLCQSCKTTSSEGVEDCDNPAYPYKVCKGCHERPAKQIFASTRIL